MMNDVTATNPTAPVSLAAFLAPVAAKPQARTTPQSVPAESASVLVATTPSKAALPSEMGALIAAAVEGAIQKALKDESKLLIQQARDAERSAQILDTAIERSISANPEKLGMMEAERKRDLAEIQKLQQELARTRRALAHAVDGTPKKFWQRLGADLSEAAEEGRDLLEFAEAMRRGELTPDISRRVYAYIRSNTEILESYADNCMAYAAEEA